ncbi:hemagglutinin repeat-containing protein [Sphingomonas cavernae]|uniref:Filamentous hemagglutinin N-terminal domain-containing protein n=1 Tax=Sphingomonas cavernae TaxID=2320861 RepID=A0A418WQ11_9SPHN|nr:hemagglutinin repeat-containing protein [Sphingomonas cavernae]RJF93321.1 filamentous hemagglutinin N-terminal domain-containing protein [Sphingomonas cavernae]
MRKDYRRARHSAAADDTSGLRHDRGRSPRHGLSALLIAALTTSALSPASGQSAPVAAPQVKPADPRTSLDVTPGGTPIVNIAAPDKNGASHNVYTELSVGQEGLIFNNSPEVGQSTIGGFLLANPNLQRSGSASLILNEVTGGVRTRLAGPMEVFGPKAALVIANPTGITCDGCGFINMSRVTLASGRLVFGADGAFSGLAVDGGDVSVEGKGLLAGNVDYFDIVAGAAHINAELYARDLTVAGGAADFDYDARTASARGGGVGSGIAIDSTLLGGMYANRIRLIGTGDGVGVNMAGLVAALDGPLHITADGTIGLGKVAGAGDVTVTAARGGIALRDQLYAGGAVNLAADGAITQDAGFIGGAGDVTLAAVGDVVTGGSGVYAGLGSDGTLSGTGALRVTAGGAIETRAATLAAETIDLTAGGALAASGVIAASGNASLKGDSVNVTGTLGADGRLAIMGRAIAIGGTATGLTGASATAADSLALGSDGALQSNGALDVSASTLANDGTLIGGAGVSLTTGSLATRGTILSGADILVQNAGDAALGGTIEANGGVNLAVGGNAATTGRIAAAGDVALDGARIDHAGSLVAGGNIALGASNAIVQGGSIEASGTLMLRAPALALAGRTVGGAGVTIESGALSFAAGSDLQSGGSLAIAATGDLATLGNIAALGAIHVSAAGSLDQQAAIAGNDRVTLAAARDLRQAGSVEALGDIALSGDSISNSGDIVGNGGLALTAATGIVSTGTLGAMGRVDLVAPRLTLGGTITSNDVLALTARDVTLEGTAAGIAGIDANISNLTLGANGALQSGAGLDLALAALDNRGLLYAAGPTRIASSGLFANGGEIVSGNSLALVAGADLSSTGLIQASTDLAADAAGAMSLAGTVYAGGDARLGAAQLDAAGVLSAKGALAIDIEGAATFASASTSYAGTALALGAADVNTAGAIQSDGTLAIAATGNLALGGQIESGATGDVRAGNGASITGTLVSKGALALNAATIDIGGAIIGEDGVTVTAASGDIALPGTISAGGDVRLAALHTLTIGTAPGEPGSGGEPGTGSEPGSGSGAGSGGSGTGGAGSGSGDGSGGTAGDGGELVAPGGAGDAGNGEMLVPGSLSAVGKAELEAEDIRIYGLVASGGDMSLLASHILKVDGSAWSQGGLGASVGSLDIGARGTLGADGLVAIRAADGIVNAGNLASNGADLDLELGGSFANSGTVVAGGTYRVSSIADYADAGTVEASVIDIAARDVSLGGPMVANDRLGVGGRNISLSPGGDLQSGDALALDAADAIALDGRIVANGDALLTSGTTLTLGGGADVAATRRLSLTAAGAITAASGSRMASGEALGLSSAAITLDGDALSNGTLTADAAGRLSTSGTLSALGELSLSGGTLDLAGAIATNSLLSLVDRAGPTTIRESALLSGDRITIGAVSDVFNAGTLAAVHGLEADIGGTLTNAATGTLQAGTFDDAGNVTATGDMRLAAGAAIDNQGLILVTGVLDIATPSFANSGTLVSASDIDLAAPSLSLGGTMISFGSVRAASTAGNLEVSGGLEGRDVTLAATGGDLLLGTDSHITAYGSGAQGFATLTSSGDIAALGTIAANNDAKLTADSAIHIGADRSAADGSLVHALTSQANIALSAGGAIVNDGTVQAAGSLTLAGASLASNNLLSGAALDFRSAGDIVLAGTTAAAGPIDLGSTGGDLTLGTLARVETADAIRLAAAGDLVNDGIIVAGDANAAAPLGTITLAAGGRLVSNGAIVSNNGDVAFEAGSVTLGGSLASGGGTWAARGLAFDTADLRIAAGGEAIAGADLAFEGRTLTLDAGSLLQSNGNVAITLGDASLAGRYDSAGQLVALGNLSLGVEGVLTNRAGSGIFAGGSGDARMGGDIVLDAASLDNAGVIAASAAPDGTRGNVTIAGGTAVNSGLIHADTALGLDVQSLTLAAPAGDGMGVVESGDALTLSIPDITIADGATLRSGDAVTIAATRFSSAGDVLAGGDIAIAARDTLTSSGTVATVGAVDLSTGGALDLAGMVSAGKTLGIEGGSVALAGTVQAWNAADPATNVVTVAATNGALDIDGALLSGGSLSLQTPAALTLGGQAALYGGTGVTGEADSIAIAASLGSAPGIASGGDIRFASQSGFVQGGAIIADGSVALADATLLDLRGGSLVSAGTTESTPSISASAVMLSAPSIAANGDIRTTGTLGFAASSLAIGGSAVANGDISLGARNGGAAPTLAIANGGTLATYLGNADLGALGGANIAGTLLASSGDVSFSAPGATIAATGEVAAGRDLRIDITGGGALAIDGSLLANRDIRLGGGTLAVGTSGSARAGQDLVFSTVDARSGTGPVSVNGIGYAMSGTPISAEVAGKLGAGRDLTLAMPGALIVHGSGEISAVNDIAVTAGQALVGARTSTDAAGNPTALGVIAGRDFTLTIGAGGRLTLDGSIQAGRNLLVDATGDVTSTAASQFITGDTLSVSGASLDLAGTNSAQNLVRLAGTGTVRLAGATATNGRIEIRGDSTLVTVTGSLSAAGGAANAVTVGRDIGAEANIDIQASGDIVNEGSIWSDGTVFLRSASGNIVNNAGGADGGITGLNTLVVQADGGSFVNSGGAFRTANAGLYLGGDFDNAGTFAPSGNYLISAANISNSGLLAASGNLTLDAAGNLVNTGTIFAGDNLAFHVGGTLTNGYAGDDRGNGNHGLILAANDISITAHDVVNESATIQSLGGDIGITLIGGDLVNRIKTLVISEVPGTGAQYPVLDGPDEVAAVFAEVGCGGSGTLANGTLATFTCTSATTVKVRYQSLSGASATYTFGYHTETRQNDTTDSSNSGTATISAAGDLTIAGGAGTITNRNSAMLAGGNLGISTSGTVNNIADLLIKNETAGGTTTLTNRIIPGAPTLIQAGSTVSIQAGDFNNIANNLVAADSYSGSQVRPNAAPGAPGNGTPGTGSAGTAAGGSAAAAGAASGGGVTAPGGSANAVGASGLAATAPGTGGLTDTQGGTLSTAGLALGGTAPVATARIGVAGGSDGADTLAPVAIDTASGADASVDGLSLASGSIDALGLTGGDAAALGGPTGAGGADSVMLALGPGFAGTGLPALGGQDFAGFLGGFLQQFNLIGADGGFALAGGGSLFTYNNNPDSAYLFTTNAALASEAALYDSSYFFGKFAPDRATTYTRLGDGFFEAMLISREVQAATGQAQLGAFGSTLDQYQGLLKNAADAQARLGLQLGIGLTDAQVSELVEPMLWYVSAKVAGRDVLVPVLYLAATDSKTIHAGALVAGENVLVSATGNITNSGTIDARNVAALSAGGNIVNASGGVVTGGSVVARAAGDILLGGGSTIAANGTGSYVVPGGSVVPGGTVALSAGRDIIGTTITTTATTTEGQFASARNWSSSTSRTETVSGATISSAAGTSLSAGRDIDLKAADITSGGATTIVAGRDVTLGGAIATSTTREAEQTGKHRLSSTVTEEKTFIGTRITSGGPITIGALDGKLSITGGSIATTNPGAGDISLYGGEGIDIAAGQSSVSSDEFARLAKRKTVTTTTDAVTNDLATIDAAGSLGVTTPGALTIAGAELNAAGALDVDAGSIAISGVIDSSSYTQDSVTKKSGLLSSKKTTTHSEGIDQSVIASTLSGDTVNLSSTGDTSILGSNVVASNGVTIATGGDLTVGAIAATDTESSSTKVKKSGISISGGGLFAGVAKSTTENEATSVTHTGSLIGSEKGDVTLDAGKALTVSGSQVVGTGTTTLAGESVTIEHVTDTVDTNSMSKSSSFGVSVGINNPVVAGIETAARMGEIATGGGANERTKAVAGLAGALAGYNAVDSLTSANGDPLKALDSLTSVSVTLGISKSKSTSETHDETAVGSQIAGQDVVIAASGAGANSTIAVTGSDVHATRDLTLAAEGGIALASAAETDTMASQNKSSGFSAGVSIGAGGITPTASVNLGRGNASGTDVTHVESSLSAGGTASVTTPGALSMKGATLSGSRVAVDVGSLSIESEQDTSTYRSKQSSVGLSASLSDGLSVAGNLSKEKQRGDFASVAEQSGIYAGSGGFDIKVGGNTNLKGAVIASEADASKNLLTTGTLSASDIANSESYRASSVTIGGGIGGIGKDKDGNASAGGDKLPGSDLPGLQTGIGTISATPPVAMGANGSQSGTTVSAIAPGAILITSGDAASEAVAGSISRDTDAANAGALAKEFDDAKRQEIALGFEASRTLTGEVGTFFANQAKKQEQAEREARPAEDKAIAAGVLRDSNGVPIRDETGNLIALNAEAQAWVDLARPAAERASSLGNDYGAGSTARLIATAVSGAAGSNVTGSVGGLVQASAVNVLQGLATSEVKGIADSLGSEEARAALQAVVGCGGSAAGGSGDCGSAAMGAAASVVLNNLLSSGDTASTDKDGKPLSLAEQQGRDNLIATIVAAVATGAGLDAGSAVSASQIETQNNAERDAMGNLIVKDPVQSKPGEDVFAHNLAVLDALKNSRPDQYADLVGKFGGDTAEGRAKAALYLAYSGDSFKAAHGGEVNVVAVVNGVYDQLVHGLNPDLASHEQLLQAAQMGRGDGGPDYGTASYARQQIAGENARPTAQQLEFATSAVFSGGVELSDVTAFATFYGGLDKIELGENAAGLGQQLGTAYAQSKAAFEKVGQNDIAYWNDPAHTAELMALSQQQRDEITQAYNYARATDQLLKPISTGERIEAGIDAVGHGVTALLTGIGTVGSLELCASIIGCAVPGGLGLMTATEADNAVTAFNRARTGLEQQTGGGYIATRVFSVDANTGEKIYVGVQVGGAVLTGAAANAILSGAAAPTRSAAGVDLNSKLPDPVAGFDYAPKPLSGGSEANQLSQLRGYQAELQLANRVADLPGETVVRYGSNVNTSGADVISVNADGTVTLWDSKFLSNPKMIGSSPTFTENSRTLASAVKQAREAIDVAKLPPAVRDKALANLDVGNFIANTPGAGAAKNSVSIRYCGNKICGN